MPDLTLQEIEEKVMAAKPWKAPGEDGLPAIVWKKLWHVVKHRIIPLRKPDKGDYTWPRRGDRFLSCRRLARFWRQSSRNVSAMQSRLRAFAREPLWSESTRPGERAECSASSALTSKAHTTGVQRANARKDESRGIPSRLVNWIDAFCSGRTASVVVNGHTSEQQTLPQAGLPQGSPLSPVAFLFFNADLVQRRIKSNRDGIQSIIDDALDWEKRSGATFEAEKTSFIHFTHRGRDSDLPLIIKNDEHIARAAAKGLAAAMCLKRLKMASPRMARQLAQRIGAQAVTGGFRTVATAVAEAEAGVQSFRERHAQAAAKFWIRMRTLRRRIL
ncbi:reverse transcriptase (RNA-dependent DNA polymerase) domain-containing protein [Hirsutella rhossiliensis]|uniref:Reverse transcriptase (RNA-dependent DNA polymerase) domain-containing protein n=1 Tax=Hirsutella rhossiliensis TaxID=111463 RepID=A0A9P8SCK4_9HYPO|nr:reverse transcriptase (RNA-dependent DNA polymerase) domain-containing protein [Hirsutella rhossiliensis]KAH0956989.1 reverse transcriptase (RNA-dependent DNA polymerase) domain-containing protein [Hirsutella rhossiliensis]